MGRIARYVVAGLLLIAQAMVVTYSDVSACDVNGDARTDVLDLQCVMDAVSCHGVAPRGDVNADGLCDILDVQHLLRYLGTSQVPAVPDAPRPRLAQGVLTSSLPVDLPSASVASGAVVLQEKPLSLVALRAVVSGAGPPSSRFDERYAYARIPHAPPMPARADLL